MRNRSAFVLILLLCSSVLSALMMEAKAYSLVIKNVEYPSVVQIDTLVTISWQIDGDFPPHTPVYTAHTNVHAFYPGVDTSSKTRNDWVYMKNEPGYSYLSTKIEWKMSVYNAIFKVTSVGDYHFRIHVYNPGAPSDQENVLSEIFTLTVTSGSTSTYVLHVQSSPITGISVSYSGDYTGSGTTNFDIGPRTSSFSVTLSAPATYQNYKFSYWQLDETNMGQSSTITVSVDDNHKTRTAIMVYSSGTTPERKFPWSDTFDYSSLSEVKSAGWTLSNENLVSVGDGALTLDHDGSLGASAQWKCFPANVYDFSFDLSVKYPYPADEMGFGSFFLHVETERHVYSWGGDGEHGRYVFSKDHVTEETSGYAPYSGSSEEFEFSKTGNLIDLYADRQRKKTLQVSDVNDPLVSVSLFAGSRSTVRINFIYGWPAKRQFRLDRDGFGFSNTEFTEAVAENLEETKQRLRSSPIADTLPEWLSCELISLYQEYQQGHCAGMVLASKYYYENRDTIPQGYVCLNDVPKNYVIDKIVYYQHAQVFLDQHLLKWLLLKLGANELSLEKQIDWLKSELDQLRVTYVGVLGRCPRSGKDISHAVLAIELIDDGTEITIWFYGPNSPNDTTVMIDIVRDESGDMSIAGGEALVDGFEISKLSFADAPIELDWNKVVADYLDQIINLVVDSVKEKAGNLWDYFTQKWESVLGIDLHSAAELHVYDSLGRHVGVGTDGVEIGFPCVYYIDQDGSEHFILPQPDAGEYKVSLLGKTDGDYELTISSCKNGTLLSEIVKAGTIKKGEMQDVAIQFSQNGTVKEVVNPWWVQNEIWIMGGVVATVVLLTFTVAIMRKRKRFKG